MPTNHPASIIMNEERQWEFYNRIDAQFPYAQRSAATELIREGCSLGGHAAFAIAYELAAVPRNRRVSAKRLNELLSEWEKAVSHPLAGQIADMVRYRIRREVPSEEKVLALASALKRRKAEPVALAVLTTACTHSDLDTEALEKDVERAWRRRRRSRPRH